LAISVLKLFADTLAERRRDERFPIELPGTCTAGAQTYPCHTIEVSSSSIAIRTHLPAQIGRRVVANIESIGVIEGAIARRLKEGWAIRVESPACRELLARKIASLAVGSPLPISKA
jgi:hypothetical protein